MRAWGRFPNLQPISNRLIQVAAFFADTSGVEHNRNIVEDLAVTLAATHPGLNAEELRGWFEQLFAGDPDVIAVWDAFREAYIESDDRDTAFTPPPLWLEEVSADGFDRIGTITLGFVAGRGLELIDMSVKLI